jgi:hypothetical protein
MKQQSDFDAVARLFRGAIGREPPAANVERIARLIDGWRDILQRPRAPKSEIVVAKGHDLSRAMKQLKGALRPVLDLMLEEGPTSDPAVTRSVDLWNAIILAEAYIPAPGRHVETWHICAIALENPVREALAGAGHSRASITADGPLVKIIHGVLGAPSTTAIASVLKRTGRKSCGKTN